MKNSYIKTIVVIMCFLMHHCMGPTAPEMPSTPKGPNGPTRPN